MEPETSSKEKYAARSDPGPVLLCYDGSDHAQQAIRHAATLLRPKHAIVIHVPRGPFDDDVAESGRQVALDGGFEPVAVVEAGHGRIATALEEAHNRRVSVIVVGSGVRSPASPGTVSSALVDHANAPVLVAGQGVARSPASEPVFFCYDGSRTARRAIATAANLLTARMAIVAAFVPAVDDLVVLQSRMPWPVGDEMEDQLARIDRQEAEAPAERAAEGARCAARAGFAARPVGISASDASSDEEEHPWKRLLRTAASAEAACVVVGHRPSVKPLGSTAHGLVHHAGCPVLVVPGENSETDGESGP